MLTSSKPHCYPRLHKPTLKILLINWNILKKQFSQATLCSNHGPQIASWTKFQIFCTELNMMVKVVRYLPKSEAAVRMCLQPFTEKHLFLSNFLLKLQALIKTPPGMFPCEFVWNFRKPFFVNTFRWWLLLLSTINLLCCVGLTNKMLLSTLAIF